MVNLKEYDCLYKPFNTCDHLLHVLQPKFSFFFMFTLHWKCAFVTCKTTLTVNCNCSCTAPARSRTYLCSCTLIFYLLLYPSESTHLNVQCTQIRVCTYIPLSVSEFSTYLHLHPYL